MASSVMKYYDFGRVFRVKMTQYAPNAIDTDGNACRPLYQGFMLNPGRCMDAQFHDIHFRGYTLTFFSLYHIVILFPAGVIFVIFPAPNVGS